jgi:hypothetical protein
MLDVPLYGCSKTKQSLMTQRLLDCGVGNTTLFIANPSLQKRLTTELTASGNGQEICKKGCGESLTLKKSILTDCGLPCWAHGKLFMDTEYKYKKYGTLRSLRYIYSNPFRFPISSLGLPNFPSQKS